MTHEIGSNVPPKAGRRSLEHPAFFLEEAATYPEDNNFIASGLEFTLKP